MHITFSTSFSTIFWLLLFILLEPWNGYEVRLHCGFDSLNSLMIDDIEHFFICYLYIFSGEMSNEVLHSFLCFCCCVVGVPYILWILNSYNKIQANISWQDKKKNQTPYRKKKLIELLIYVLCTFCR